MGALLPENAAEDALDEFVSKVPRAPFTEVDLYDLAELIEEFLPSLDTSHLRSFLRPTAVAGGEEFGPRVLWQHAMAVVPLSPESRGVLAELKALGHTSKWSRPLNALFSEEGQPGRSWWKRSPPLLATLSAAQKQAIQSASTYPLTLLYGPPGTGKSFTAGVLALDQVERAHSVLIAARTNQALDAIQDKLDELLGERDLFLRGGAERDRSPASLLDKWLRFGANNKELEKAKIQRLPACRSALKKAQRKLLQRERLERDYSADGTGWFSKIRAALAERQLRSAPSWLQLFEKFNGRLGEAETLERRALLQKLQERRFRAMTKERAHARTLRSALGARTIQRQNAHFSRIPRRVLFGGFPLWLTTLSAVYDTLPMEAEMFDLAIIDEATQCDMASALPIFQRARRVVVTGDPKQLRHLSFLSSERQRTIASQYLGDDPGELIEQFNYRDRSLLDLVLEHLSSHAQVVFLNEHFRSRPEIISFSNRQFYEGKLKLMRAHERRGDPALTLVRGEGKRDEKRVNAAEAADLIQTLASRVAGEKASTSPSSIGVLSPFRHQVDHLEKLIDKRFPLETIRRHRMRVGTAYSFQGDERDLMLISLALDDESHLTAFRYLERPDVFNDAITRARNEQVVFHSFDPERREPESLTRQYLETRTTTRPAMTEEVQNPLIRKLAGEIERGGASVAGGREPCRHIRPAGAPQW